MRACLLMPVLVCVPQAAEAAGKAEAVAVNAAALSRTRAHQGCACSRHLRLAGLQPGAAACSPSWS